MTKLSKKKKKAAAVRSKPDEKKVRAALAVWWPTWMPPPPYYVPPTTQESTIFLGGYQHGFMDGIEEGRRRAEQGAPGKAKKAAAQKRRVKTSTWGRK